MQKTNSKAKILRRPVHLTPAVETAGERSRTSSVSGNVSQDGESLAPRQLPRGSTWDTSSQTSTKEDRSSIGSYGFDRRTSYSTAATEPSLANSGKLLKKLGPLNAHLETINNYDPGRTATEIWTSCVLEFGSTVEGPSDQSGEQSEASPDNSNLWRFWEAMANIADQLVTAEYLVDGFDMHYLCFVEIFTDTGRRLSHWKPPRTSGGCHDIDQKTSEVIAGTPTVLQLLNRAAIGAARSCTTAAHSKLARVMLDAAHSILRQSKNPSRVRVLLILFDIYRNTLMEVWNSPPDASPADRFTMKPVSAKSSRLDQEFCLDDLHHYIHPTILNREYLLLSAHLLNLPRYQRSWLSLPARSTQWDRPLAQLIRSLAIPSKTNQGTLTDAGLVTCIVADRRLAWTEFAKPGPNSELVGLVDSYIRDAKAFLQWCINMIFEGQTILDGGLNNEPQTSPVASRDFLDEARLTLYWFLVGRYKSPTAQAASNNEREASSLPKFPHCDTHPATFDAFYILSSFIFGFSTSEPLPASLPSIADYALNRAKQIMKWPHGFVWLYLQETLSQGSRLYAEGDFLRRKVERRHVDHVINRSDDTNTTEVSHVAVELHPQPLPELIVAPSPVAHHTPTKGPRKSHAHSRAGSRVTFAESTIDSQASPSPSSGKNKKRWYTRLSMSRIEEAIQTNTNRLSLNNVSSKPKSISMPGAGSSAMSRPSQTPVEKTSIHIRMSESNDFPGSYMAIAPLMSSPTSIPGSAIDTEREREGRIRIVPDCQPPTPVTTTRPDDALSKIDSVVRTTEILLPENRPAFVVLH
jgi:hypothetical protein